MDLDSTGREQKFMQIGASQYALQNYVKLCKSMLGEKESTEEAQQRTAPSSVHWYNCHHPP